MVPGTQPTSGHRHPDRPSPFGEVFHDRHSPKPAVVPNSAKPVWCANQVAMQAGS
ncbi:hypothetical protein RHOER0001_4518 [Rhodococcus erythropolis SK121]|nr:hypothetical protein RHOER0001_4518 [Rhodococcus erythropolis SK121]